MVLPRLMVTIPTPRKNAEEGEPKDITDMKGEGRTFESDVIFCITGGNGNKLFSCPTSQASPLRQTLLLSSPP
jgi:hypothetical protein